MARLRRAASLLCSRSRSRLERRRGCGSARSRFVALAPLAARLGRPHALRPLAGGARRRRARRARRRRRPARPRRCSALAVAAKLYPAVLAAARARLRLAARAAGARRSSAAALVRRRVALASSSRSSSLAPGRGLGQPRRASSARPLQIESLGAALLLAAHHVSGSASTMRLEPRLAEPRRRRRRTRSRSSQTVAPGRRARRGLDLVRARARPTRERLVRARAAAVCRVRRVREGALAAVPDLADPARAARPRAARAAPRRRCSRSRSS